MTEGLVARQVVGLASVAAVDEHLGGDGGDVADVDVGRLPFRRRQVDHAAQQQVVALIGEEVLHVERRPQDGEREARRLQGQLDLAVGARWVLVSARHRAVDDVFDAGRLQRGDERRQERVGVLVKAGGDQKDALNAAQGSVKGRWRAEIEGHRRM